MFYRSNIVNSRTESVILRASCLNAGQRTTCTQHQTTTSS